MVIVASGFPKHSQLKGHKFKSCSRYQRKMYNICNFNIFEHFALPLKECPRSPGGQLETPKTPLGDTNLAQ